MAGVGSEEARVNEREQVSCRAPGRSWFLISTSYAVLINNCTHACFLHADVELSVRLQRNVVILFHVILCTAAMETSGPRFTHNSMLAIKSNDF